MVCQFLLYNKVNQLYIYIYHHISSLSCLPPSLPSLSHLSRWSQSTELISLCYAAASHQLSISHLVVYIHPCHSLTLSQLTLPPPHILKSILQQVCVKCFLIAIFYAFPLPHVHMACSYCLTTIFASSPKSSFSLLLIQSPLSGFHTSDNSTTLINSTYPGKVKSTIHIFNTVCFSNLCLIENNSNS